MGYAIAQLVEALRYKPESRRLDSRWGCLLTLHFLPHYGCEIHLDSHRNEYQGYPLVWEGGGVKEAGTKGRQPGNFPVPII